LFCDNIVHETSVGMLCRTVALIALNDLSQKWPKSYILCVVRDIIIFSFTHSPTKTIPSKSTPWGRKRANFQSCASF